LQARWRRAWWWWVAGDGGWSQLAFASEGGGGSDRGRGEVVGLARVKEVREDVVVEGDGGFSVSRLRTREVGEYVVVASRFGSRL
jgi:hypothetical protein